MTTTTPRKAVEELQKQPLLVHGDDERFTGYGVMGLPFTSGHHLGLRDMVATSIGPAYRSIWLRDPDERWAIHATGPADVTCPRYFGAVAAWAYAPAVDVAWEGDHCLVVTAGDWLNWRIELAETPATWMMTGMGGALPEAAWNSNAVLAGMGPLARTMLRTGRIRLCGSTPNGQHFRVAPLKVWRVVGSTATLRGVDLGAPAPLPEQVSLGDFWLPQRGLFFVGHARFSTGAGDDVHPIPSSATMEA